MSVFTSFPNFFSGARRGPASCALTLALELLATLGGHAQAPAAAPRPARPDTLLNERRHRLPEARVRAVRPERFAVGSRQVVLDSLALAQYRGGTLVELLEARTPLYFKNYGPGQLASISLRGTAARHTAVLWQGFNINVPSLGEADFAILPVGAATSIAVQLGPAALYGSGAIGGVILLDQETDWRPGLRGSLQADAGSWGLRGGSLAARGATARLAIRTTASWRTAQNDYPYTIQEARGPTQYRLPNAALRHQWSLSQDLALRLGERGELTATAWLTDTYRDIMPSVYAAPTQTRELDQSRRLLLGYRHQASAQRQWSVRGAWFEDVLDYLDGGATSHSLMRTTQAQAEHTAALGTRGSLRIGAEVQHFAADIDGYGATTVAENRAAAFALLRYDPRPGLRLSGNLRQAFLPGGAAPLTPTVGLAWDWPGGQAVSPADSVQPVLTFKASASRSYRAPTLNERYWRPGGNPDLRPESGWGYDGGAQLRQPLGPLASLLVEATAFHQLVDEWVQWTPNDQGIWSPRNLRQVRSQGLETSLAYRLRYLRYRLHARAAYSLTHTMKVQGAAADYDPVGVQLMYVPRNQATVVVDQQYRGWVLSAQASATGRRYIDASAIDFLPAYAVAGATLGHTWRLAGCALTSSLRLSNVLNQAYFGYPGRPAPPRAWQASVRLDWH